MGSPVDENERRHELTDYLSGNNESRKISENSSSILMAVALRPWIFTK
jgi:hypothetical protein